MLDEPLGLTVHSLPLPQDAAEADSRRTVSGRVKMLLVLAVCAAPVIASYLTYYVVHPQNARSYGTLVQPRDVPASLAQLKGQWLLVSVAGGACDPACENNLYIQRQLRESLGREKDRVDWVWLVDDAAPIRPELQAALSQATVQRVDAQQLAQWFEPEGGHSLHEHLYLVDPMGRWMMRFPAAGDREVDTSKAKNIKRDIDRLLRASASWDLPGR
ncbi:MAG TPA: hypothetical protein VMZ74_07155 [Ramlibacter sp.]|nr:hypothetical protein [Ramlibacter sp.]